MVDKKDCDHRNATYRPDLKLVWCSDCGAGCSPQEAIDAIFRAHAAEKILGNFADGNPMCGGFLYSTCSYCGSYEDDPHENDCVWLTVLQRYANPCTEVSSVYAVRVRCQLPKNHQGMHTHKGVHTYEGNPARVVNYVFEWDGKNHLLHER